MKIGRSTTLTGAWSLAIGATALVLGCETSSHKSVRTYEYNEQPRGERTAQPTETERVEDAGDWQMTKPGEMVVDPKGGP